MTTETISALVNMGSAGAVIAVVIIFLKELGKRDQQWRDFFIGIRQGDAQATKELTLAMQQMAQNVASLTDKLSDHDEMARRGIDELKRVASSALPRKTQPRKPE